MRIHRKLWQAAALAATPLSLLAGWCWSSGHEPRYAAHARIVVPAVVDAARHEDPALPSLEETLLSPDVILAAADRLRDSGITLPTGDAPDADVGYLLGRIETECRRDGERQEIEIRYEAADAEQALATLTAVVDAGLSALRSTVPVVEDPAAGGRERERIQIAQALESQRSRIAELESRIADGEPAGGDATTRGETLRSLTASLAELRERRVDAEDRLAQARRELRAGATLEQIVAGIPDGAEWNPTREMLSALHRQGELRQKESELQAAGGVYGRNHPRMIALQNEVARLRQQFAATQPEGSADVASSTELAAEFVLRTLEARRDDAVRAELAVEQQIADAQHGEDERRLLAWELADAGQELAFLKSEASRIEQEITQARHEADRRLPGLAEPPTLDSEPIEQTPAGALLWAGAGGLMFTSGLWRLASRVPARARALAPQSRPRLSSEDNLARLRRLKPAH